MADYILDVRGVDCVGEIEDDSNFECVFGDPKFDGIFVDMPYALFGDNWNGEPSMTWLRVVNHMQAWAKSRGTTVEQITAC